MTSAVESSSATGSTSESRSSSEKRNEQHARSSKSVEVNGSSSSSSGDSETFSEASSTESVNTTPTPIGQKPEFSTHFFAPGDEEVPQPKPYDVVVFRDFFFAGLQFLLEPFVVEVLERFDV